MSWPNPSRPAVRWRTSTRSRTVGMDDKSLHDLLNGALAGEPPIGPVAQNSLGAGIRLRQRRRALAAAGCAAVAVIAVIIQTGTGLIGHSPGPAGRQRPGTAYVADQGERNLIGRITPINTATNRAEGAIWAGVNPEVIAITPDGKTLYVANVGSRTVRPISTATNTPGKPIKVDVGPELIAITPNGKTAYVAGLSSRRVIPINTATNTAGKPIKVGLGPDFIAFTPNGETAYVANYNSGTVTPINTATNVAGKPIKVGASPKFIATNGKTAYVSSASKVTPISTA